MSDCAKFVAQFEVICQLVKNTFHRISYFDRVDDNDNEEINELSRLQDPANQEPQVGGSINEPSYADKINPPTADNALVPSDQNQSSSDTLANISDFLKNKEGEGTGPGRQFVSLLLVWMVECGMEWNVECVHVMSLRLQTVLLFSFSD